MKKKIVIALGGNALGNNLEEQMTAVKSTAKSIVDLIEEGHDVVISHGNGPQVGMINLAMDALTKSDKKYSSIPMSVCVAMSQGYVGYDLQNALREELLNRNISKPVATIITQVEVDKNDKAFKNPTKPIGSFMTKEEADILISKGVNVIEDAGRGYRRVVASPKPKSIVEIEVVKTLVESGSIVVACGGGGIPVMKEGNHLRGASAVIDKDFASATLAKELEADFLIILTAVEKAAINYGKENEKWLDNVSVVEMKKYVEEGHFAPGSMRPKVEAGIEFAEYKEGNIALITLLEKAKDGILGETGTRITK
ncbi:carbamate kinase [Clostridium sp.]|uniref:carbamate kinase n=1 Tax=Clostridium sp. TaxID=1506 RepID=UPI002914644D|nr:carbamate kinase [Clostridium sp.]MDU5105340.1 carbamate kinase [Clostridium sp.]